MRGDDGNKNTKTKGIWVQIYFRWNHVRSQLYSICGVCAMCDSFIVYSIEMANMSLRHECCTCSKKGEKKTKAKWNDFLSSSFNTFGVEDIQMIWALSRYEVFPVSWVPVCYARDLTHFFFWFLLLVSFLHFHFHFPFTLQLNENDLFSGWKKGTIFCFRLLMQTRLNSKIYV